MIVSFLQLVFIFLFIRQIIIFILAWYTGTQSEVPFKPTAHQHISLITKYLKTQLEPNKKYNFLEIGSGSGRVSLSLAKKFPLNISAIEKNPVLHQLSKIKSWMSWNKKGKIKWQKADLFKISFANYELIYFYLLPNIIEAVADRLVAETPATATIISYCFPIKHPQLKLQTKLGNKKSPLYIYQKKDSIQKK